MPSLGLLIWPAGRLGRADFVFAVVLALLLAIGGAALAFVGRNGGGLVYVAGLWMWLVVHMNRRHDHDRSGAVVLLVWPLAATATVMAALVLVVATGIDMPGPEARPTGDEPAYVYAYVGAVLILSLAGVEWEAIRHVGASLAALALVPLAVTLIVTVLIGAAPESLGANRWGPSRDGGLP